MAVLKCTSLYTVQRQVFLAKNLLLHGTTAIHGGSEMYIRVHFYLQACYTNLLLRGTSGIHAAVEQCTSLYTVQRQVFLAKNLLLHGTTDIPVRPEILSVSLLKRDDVDTRS